MNKKIDWFNLLFFGTLGVAFSFSWIVFGTFLLPQVLERVDASLLVRMFLALGIAGGTIIISKVTIDIIFQNQPKSEHFPTKPTQEARQ